jgi:transcriptional regulator with XRE-family HTH domain
MNRGFYGSKYSSVIVEVLKKLNWSQQQLAERSGVSLLRVNRIISKKVLKKGTKSHIISCLQKIQNTFGGIGVFIPIEEMIPELFPELKSFKEVDFNNQTIIRSNFYLCPKRQEMIEVVSNVVEKLDLKERENTIFKMWFEGKKLREIGKELNLTRQRVQQLFVDVCEKIRDEIKKEEHPEIVRAKTLMELTPIEKQFASIPGVKYPETSKRQQRLEKQERNRKRKLVKRNSWKSFNLKYKINQKGFMVLLKKFSETI